MDLTDEQWRVLESLFPEPAKRADGRGRPWRGTRAVINGVLWVLRTGAPWRDLPKRYPSYQTCQRRFQGWACDGTLERVLAALSEDLRERGELDLSECFIDATFVGARKGEGAWERPSGAKVRSSWRWQTALASLLPCTWRALPHTRSPS